MMKHPGERGCLRPLENDETDFSDSCGVGSKRSLKWCMDATEAELCKKKKVVQASDRPILANCDNADIVPWEDSSMGNLKGKEQFWGDGSSGKRSIGSHTPEVPSTVSDHEDPDSREPEKLYLADEDGNLTAIDNESCNAISSASTAMTVYSDNRLAPLAPKAETVSLDVASVTSPGNMSKSKSKTKTKKLVAPTSFPQNVRSLISTGIFDGVPVRYISASREELKGTIKDSGYLCGCKTCNFSKVLNAYEFEHHAGCKTKHPHSHIYFENGKTLYGIVQELRSTPEEALFEKIQMVTGSHINQTAFCSWKESFRAATLQLERIYSEFVGSRGIS